ncbi:MAG TPA: hypothetical protein VHH88_09650 [Verrucomicrobiae bacterium]|nr:hypothetical protein [Verrucomicrobiae bacterium]
MATRMNMMKLLLEVRGFAEFTHKRMPARPLGPLLLQVSGPSSRFARGMRKWTLRVSIQDPPEIPHPVPIKHLGSPSTKP